MLSKNLKTVFAFALILLVFSMLCASVCADYAPEGDITSAVTTAHASSSQTPENTAVPSLTTAPVTSEIGNTALESTQPNMENSGGSSATDGATESSSGGIIGVVVAVLAAVAVVVVIFIVAPKGRR